jgi:hypothetical protein
MFPVWLPAAVVASRRLRTAAGAVVPHQCVHIPVGRDWDCAECRARWPCRTYKEIVWAANHGDRERVTVVMTWWSDSARDEILLSEPEYHLRFKAWIQRWPNR